MVTLLDRYMMKIWRNVMTALLLLFVVTSGSASPLPLSRTESIPPALAEPLVPASPPPMYACTDATGSHMCLAEGGTALPAVFDGYAPDANAAITDVQRRMVWRRRAEGMRLSMQVGKEATNAAAQRAAQAAQKAKEAQ